MSSSKGTEVAQIQRKSIVEPLVFVATSHSGVHFGLMVERIKEGLDCSNGATADQLNYYPVRSTL